MAIYYGRHPANVNTIVEKRVYVEVPEGSTIDDMSDQNTVALTSDQYSNLQKAFQYRTNTNNDVTIPQMIDGLNTPYNFNISLNMEFLTDDSWIRPNDWPDLDSLNLQMSGDDFIYMTYNANIKNSAIVWHIETANKAAATLDIGHIENGTYIADETYSVAHNTNFVKWTDEYSGYLVLRITGQIYRCYSYSVTSNGVTQMYRQQPILERIAWVPHLYSFCTNYNSNAWTLYTLQREKIANNSDSSLLSLYYAWSYGYKLHSLDISGLHTDKVTDFTCAFYSCYYLKYLDLRHFVVNKVTSFSSTFSYCRSLHIINMTGWNTSSVTNFSSMFNNCRCLTSIPGLENFNTSKATTMSGMFNICDSLHEIPVDNFDVSNVTNFSTMFSECYSVEKLNVSNWRPVKATNFSALFSNCWSLKELDLSNWCHGALTSVGSMFNQCRSLYKIDISWLHLTHSCTSIYCMFYNCWNLVELNFPDDWDVSGLGNGTNTANNMFASCYSLVTITGIKNWNFQLTNSLTSMFANCHSLKNIDISGWNVSTTNSLSSLFSACYSLEHINLDNWQPTNCVSFASMFSGCRNLKELPQMTDWVTAKTTNISSMFSACESVKTLPDIDSWDVSKVTTTASMFSSMYSLKEITILNWDLASCTTIVTMFRYCYNLKKVRLLNWSLPKLNTAPAQFLGDCYNLEEVEIFPIPLAHSYTNDVSLTHTSLLNIINSLPQTTTTRTLNLLTQNINHLTAAEKAIATGKGWTLAN